MDLVQEPNSTRPLLIRADADSRMGTGHVMRCIALGQAWQDRGRAVTFLSAPLPDPLEARLMREGFLLRRLEVEPGSPADALAVAALAREIHAEWIVTDGYHFDSSYQDACRNAGFHLLFIDDNAHAGRYSADIVLNQNIHATSHMYPARTARTRFLLGTRYCLLRREFLAQREALRCEPEIASNILVTMGGSDGPNVTGKVIQALRELHVDLHARVVIGPGNPHRQSLREFANEAAHDFEFIFVADRMSELMRWAHMAISAAGSTCWELMYLGVPSAVISIATNQTPTAKHLGEIGAVLDLGWYSELSADDLSLVIGGAMRDAELRRQLSRRSLRLVDGQGARRVVSAIEEVCH